MKKITFLLAICLSLVSFAQAQIPPQAFNYSAVARNAAGQPIASSAIGIQITILKTSTTGTSVYSENHFVNTDAYGLFNLVIGGGSVQSGNMSTIDWSADNYYLKVGMDANGGTIFLNMGTTQLLSVPYAMHAKTAETLIGGATGVGKTYIELFGEVTNVQADSILTADLGPNTQFVYITNTTQLTAVDLTGVNSLMELKIIDNQALTSVNAATLTRCSQLFKISNNVNLNSISLNNANYFGITEVIGNTVLTSLNLPLLTKSGIFNIDNNNALASINAPALTKTNSLSLIGNGLTSVNFSALNTISGELTINSNNLLTSLNLTSLAIITSGSININNNNSLSSINLNGLTNLSGSINIQGNSSLATATFNGLTNAASFSIQGNGLTSFSFPALTNATDFIIQGNGLTTLSFPALTTLTGGFSIQGNPSLGTFSAPSLTSCGGINFAQNGVTSINLGALATMGGQLSLNANANLTSCSLASLASAQSISISNNGLTSLSLPALQNLPGNGSGWTIQISNNSAMTSLSVGSLTTTTAIQISNNGLTSISFPSLQSLTGGVSTSYNFYSSLFIDGNTSINNINISSLSSLSEGLRISNNTSPFTLQAGALSSAKFISIENNGITAINLPALQILTAAIPGAPGVISGSLVILNNPNLTSISANALNSMIAELNVSTNPALSSVSFTSLNSVSQIQFEDNGPMGSVSFPSLTSVQTLEFLNNGMTSLSFPILTTVQAYFNVIGNSSLATLNIGALTTSYNLNLPGNALSNIIWPSSFSTTADNLDLSQNSLPSSEINEILALIVSGSVSFNGCVYLNNQNPAAPPTGQGLIDIDTIQNVWGACVTTD